MEDCIVCFEKTCTKTACQHFLCKPCQRKLIRPECPYCRRPIVQFKEIKMALYDFIFLFKQFYMDNTTVLQILNGVDSQSLISTDVLFYIEQIDDFDDRGITLQISKNPKIMKNGYFSSFHAIDFYAPGIDSQDTIHEYRFSSVTKQGHVLLNYI